MTRLRLSYVTAGFPFPLSSGYLRHHHLLRALAPDHDVRLRSLVGPGFDHGDVAGVDGSVTDVAVFPAHRATGARRTAALLWPERRREVAQLRAAISADIDDGIDAVILSGKDTASVLGAVGGRVPVVVDLCDATSARLTQQLRHEGALRRSALVLRRRAVRRIERRLVDGGDVLLTASARDRDLLRQEGAPHRVGDARVVPNGIDLGAWTRQDRTLGQAVVLCANLGYRPNADAARRLVGDIMPHVWARRPHTVVEIVGVGASPGLLADLAHPQVTTTGPVPDVRPHLEGAAVVAAPLRIATGIQNKVLEAMAMEIPVVTTAVAAAGLGPGAPLTIADDAAAAAAAILNCLDAVDAGATAPDHRAREWVAERFDWERSGRMLADAVRAAGAVEAVSW